MAIASSDVPLRSVFGGDRLRSVTFVAHFFPFSTSWDLTLDGVRVRALSSELVVAFGSLAVITAAFAITHTETLFVVIGHVLLARVHNWRCFRALCALGRLCSVLTPVLTLLRLQ